MHSPNVFEDSQIGEQSSGMFTSKGHFKEFQIRVRIIKFVLEFGV